MKSTAQNIQTTLLHSSCFAFVFHFVNSCDVKPPQQSTVPYIKSILNYYVFVILFFSWLWIILSLFSTCADAVALVYQDFCFFSPTQQHSLPPLIIQRMFRMLLNIFFVNAFFPFVYTEWVRHNTTFCVSFPLFGKMFVFFSSHPRFLSLRLSSLFIPFKIVVIIIFAYVMVMVYYGLLLWKFLCSP